MARTLNALLEQTCLRGAGQKRVDHFLWHRSVDRRQRVADVACRARSVSQVERFVDIVLTVSTKPFESVKNELAGGIAAEAIGEIGVAERVERAANGAVPAGNGTHTP